MKLHFVIAFILVNISSLCVGGRWRRPSIFKPKITNGRVYSKPPSPSTRTNHPVGLGQSGVTNHHSHPAYSQSHPYSSSGAYGYHPSYGQPGYHPNAAFYNPPVGVYSHTTIINQGSTSHSSDLATFFLLGAATSSFNHRHYHYQNAGTNTTVINNYYGSSTVSGSNVTSPIISSGNVVGKSFNDMKFTSPNNVITSRHELEEFTELLLTKDNNYFLKKYITTNFQGLKINNNDNDDAFDHFLTVKKPSMSRLMQGFGRLNSTRWNETSSTMTKNALFKMESSENEAPWNESTFKTLLALYDNYLLDATLNENVTEQQRNEEDNFINAIVETEVMKRTKDFLVQKKYLSNDLYEFKIALKNMWFTRFERVTNVTGGSGFEYVFLAEKFQNIIFGLHNWIYYALREADEQLNYLGYFGNVSLGDYGTFAKVKSKLNGTINEATTLFIGLSPELELSLYTLCFYISPNQPCPIKLADNAFIIFVLRNKYHNTDVVVSVDAEYEPPHQIINNDASKHSNASQIYPMIFQAKIIILLLTILFQLN